MLSRQKTPNDVGRSHPLAADCRRLRRRLGEKIDDGAGAGADAAGVIMEPVERINSFFLKTTTTPTTPTTTHTISKK